MANRSVTRFIPPRAARTSSFPIPIRAVAAARFAAIATRLVFESCEDNVACCWVAVEGVIAGAGFSVEAVGEAFVLVGGCRYFGIERFGIEYGCIVVVVEYCLSGSHSAGVRAKMGNSTLQKYSKNEDCARLEEK